jgi:hypothetical protein
MQLRLMAGEENQALAIEHVIEYGAAGDRVRTRQVTRGGGDNRPQ